MRLWASVVLGAAAVEHDARPGAGVGGPRGLRVAWSPDLGFAEVDPEIARVAHAALLRWARRSPAPALGRPGAASPLNAAGGPLPRPGAAVGDGGGAVSVGAAGGSVRSGEWSPGVDEDVSGVPARGSGRGSGRVPGWGEEPGPVGEGVVPGTVGGGGGAAGSLGGPARGAAAWCGPQGVGGAVAGADRTGAAGRGVPSRTGAGAEIRVVAVDPGCVDPAAEWFARRAVRGGRESRADRAGRSARPGGTAEDHNNNRLDALFASADLLATPTTPNPPHGHDGPGDVMSVALTWLFNITGHPAVSLPAGFTADGLPVGLHLVAPHHRDALLLAAAADYEAACPWPPTSSPVPNQPSQTPA